MEKNIILKCPNHERERERERERMREQCIFAVIGLKKSNFIGKKIAFPF
jgi:hypothetical protein